LRDNNLKPPNMLKPLFVWENKVYKKIQPETVVFLAIEENYTRIYLVDGSFLTVRATLASALKLLPSDLFIKVHRSYAVSVLHIDTIHRDHVEIGDQPIPIGRQYYQKFLSRLDVIE
jgi:DNA-binding LytR/AlgR family response regulator